jgi:two-component system, OmpR family, alkaline phosphatase synthesis response regulator PhoP
LPRVAIVAQDPASAESLARILTQAGFTCSTVADGESAVASAVAQNPDAVLFDLGSHDHVLETVHEIRESINVPALAILTSDSLAGIPGHFADVDDFISRPVNAAELQLRVRRVLRKASVQGDEVMKSGELTIDLAKCEVSVDGRAVVLTFKEYELLKYLVSNQGRVCTRETLLDKVWGFDYYGGDRTVDVHIRRLRSKIEDATHTFIDTIRNIGYRFKTQC